MKETAQNKKLPQKQRRKKIILTQRSYDAAATNRFNVNYWIYADSKDADSLIFADLATLRNRARYEVRNNSYAKGIIETKANDIVGSGPRLQMATGGKDTDREIEDKFYQWSENCDFSGRLSLAEIIRLAGSLQQDESGEAFIVFQNENSKENWLTYKPQVTLRLAVIEPDRVTTPLSQAVSIYNSKMKAGIELDDNGRPIFYYISKKHPGSAFNISYGEYDKIPAYQVIHLYRQDRPGQSRGVPWLTPALPLFAQLRRYTTAVVRAAEKAASISAIIETSITEGDEDQLEVGDEIEIPQDSILTIPGGNKLTQMKPEQPSSNYKEFKAEILNEIGRCLNMPYNVVAANSAEYNYASGRLDWQVYFRFIKTIRSWLVRVALNRIFFTWLREAMLTRNYLRYPPSLQLLKTIIPTWVWPGAEHVDPVKEAAAQKIRLGNLTTSLAAEYALQGKDWERELQQVKKELELIELLGLSNPFNQNSKSNIGTPKTRESGLTIKDRNSLLKINPGNNGDE